MKRASLALGLAFVVGCNGSGGGPGDTDSAVAIDGSVVLADGSTVDAAPVDGATADTLTPDSRVVDGVVPVDTRPADATVDARLADAAVDARAVDSATPDAAIPDAAVFDVNPVDAQPGSVVVDLVVDTNRNGQLEPGVVSEDTGEDNFTTTAGAVFLANVDDDDDNNSDDSTDTVVNGPDDLLDLTRFQVRPWADAPNGAQFVLTTDTTSSQLVRIFKFASGTSSPTIVTPPYTISTADVRSGVEFGIEGRFFATGSWNGKVTLTLTATDTTSGAALGTDVAVMRVAPFMLPSHLEPSNRVYVAGINEQDSRVFRTGIQAGALAGGAAYTEVPSHRQNLLDSRGQPDQWTQDHWEIGYQAVPAPGNTQRVMNVVFRAATEPRPAADFAKYDLFGKDFGYIHPRANNNPQTHDVSMDSTGNMETVPPYTAGNKVYPMGRVLIGSGTWRKPDQTVVAFFNSQAFQGPVVHINTQFLIVGHVDEITSFVRAPGTARGWKLMIASPRLARQMLADAVAANPANGNVQMFVGKNVIDWDNGRYVPAARTINNYLADADHAQMDSEAQAYIDTAKAVLVSELGLAADEVVEVPVMFEAEYYDDGQGGTIGQYIAYLPGTVNQLVVNDHLVIPDPFGPKLVGTTTDMFKTDLEARYAPLGYTLGYADDWDLYHILSGEVHCGTNTLRDVTLSTRWWTVSR